MTIHWRMQQPIIPNQPYILIMQCNNLRQAVAIDQHEMRYWPTVEWKNPRHPIRQYLDTFHRKMVKEDETNVRIERLSRKMSELLYR